MRFSLVTIGLTIAAAAVNAAALVKRAIDPDVQQCIDDLVAINSQLVVVSGLVAAFTSSAGYAGALNIHSAEQTLENLIETAIDDCCAIDPASVNDEEANAVLDVVDDLVPLIVSTLSTLDSKKPQFDAVLLATLIVKTDIKNLDTKTSQLDTCLLDACPAGMEATCQALIDQINDAFDTTNSVWGI